MTNPTKQAPPTHGTSSRASGSSTSVYEVPGKTANLTHITISAHSAALSTHASSLVDEYMLGLPLNL